MRGDLRLKMSFCRKRSYFKQLAIREIKREDMQYKFGKLVIWHFIRSKRVSEVYFQHIYFLQKCVQCISL